MVAGFEITTDCQHVLLFDGNASRSLRADNSEIAISMRFSEFSGDAACLTYEISDGNTGGESIEIEFVMGVEGLEFLARSAASLAQLIRAQGGVE